MIARSRDVLEVPCNLTVGYGGVTTGSESSLRLGTFLDKSRRSDKTLDLLGARGCNVAGCTRPVLSLAHLGRLD